MMEEMPTSSASHISAVGSQSHNIASGLCTKSLEPSIIVHFRADTPQITDIKKSSQQPLLGMKLKLRTNYRSVRK